MIIENAAVVFFDILSWFLSRFTDFDNTVFHLENYMDEIDGIVVFFEYAFYLFPLDAFLSCFAFIFALMIFRIVVALLRMIWEVIPWL